MDFGYNFEIVNSGSENELAAWLCSCVDCKAALPRTVNRDLTAAWHIVQLTSHQT